MQLADLLFMAAMLATLVSAIQVIWRLVRGPRSAARRITSRWAIGAASYFAILLVVSLVQPGRVVPLGSDECFDDWCIAVTAMESHDARMVITLRVSNRGRGRSQAEPDAYVYLRDAQGREVQSSATTPGTTSLSDPIPAGQSRAVLARFDVPRDFRAPALVKARRARFPANVIIGDPTSVLHRPTVHALTRSSES